jgi:hypothetical protein
MMFSRECFEWCEERVMGESGLPFGGFERHGNGSRGLLKWGDLRVCYEKKNWPTLDYILKN